METEIKQCQNCKKDFTIEESDFNFYEKMKVPAPTWCPECRLIRRLTFQNTWNLFWRKCDKCDKKTLSMYPQELDMTVYCQSCWWSDDWDGTEYGMDYEPSQPFLEQIKELINKTPHSALESNYLTLKNSEYTNGIAWSKECFMVFWADFCESVLYSSILNGLKWSSDCIRGWESELCYDSIGFIRHYRVVSTDESDSCIDVWFSRNCYSCTNCIGCVNLRGVKNCIFNVQYSPEEYKEKVEELGLDSWKKLRELEKKAHDFWLTKPYREYHGHSLNLNVTGEYAFESKNSKEGYIMNYAENSKWVQLLTVPSTKDSYDYSGWGNNATQIYESVTVGENADLILFSTECWPDVYNLQYGYWNIACKNGFGNANLKRKPYCILNKQYSKEEFEKLKSQIIQDMKKNPYIDKLGHKYFYGEFLPTELSKFPYNKSNAMRFFPKTKEQVLQDGYEWDDTENPSNPITIKSANLPDTILDTIDSILNEVIECGSCARGYKIVKGELDLLRKLGLPIPHECPKCRENARFARMTKPGLYHRACDKCSAPIYTPYAPGRPEIVYCVKCFQAEFA
jgi:hypothetical protein